MYTKVSIYIDTKFVEGTANSTIFSDITKNLDNMDVAANEKCN